MLASHSLDQAPGSGFQGNLLLPLPIEPESVKCRGPRQASDIIEYGSCQKHSLETSVLSPPDDDDAWHQKREPQFEPVIASGGTSTSCTTIPGSSTCLTCRLALALYETQCKHHMSDCKMCRSFHWLLTAGHCLMSRIACLMRTLNSNTVSRSFL